MKVPEYWWPTYNSYKFSRIDSFDISSQKWNLLLDSRDESFPFLMSYDAVSMSMPMRTLPLTMNTN
jgi:hypothetical protein